MNKPKQDEKNNNLCTKIKNLFPRKSIVKATAEKTDGKITPEATAEKTDGKITPEATAEKTDGKITPEATAEKTDGKTTPEATTEKTDGKTTPEATTEKTDGKTTPEATTEKTDGKTTPEATDEKTTFKKIITSVINFFQKINEGIYKLKPDDFFNLFDNKFDNKFIIAIISISPLVFTYIIIFNYLKHINSLFLLPDINIIPLAYAPFFIALAICLLSILLTILFIIILYIFFKKVLKFINNKEEPPLKLFFFIITITLVAITYITYQIIAQNFWILISTPPIIMLLVLALLHPTPTKIQKLTVILSTIIALLIIAMVAIIINKSLSSYILKIPNFIESKEQSSGYTIDYRFFAPNNLTPQEKIFYDSELKEYFGFDAYEDLCNGVEPIEKHTECANQINKTISNQYRHNVFYGYMAWNVGEYKVFCPYQYDNIEGGKQNYKCLASKAEYIVPFY